MKIIQIGNLKGKEIDLLAILDSPYENIKMIAQKLKSVISLKNFNNNWCPFHWFETMFFFDQNTIPIHILLYGSEYEMMAVENNSVFNSFYDLIGIKEKLKKINEELRQLLADIWRLRMCLIELLITPIKQQPLFILQAEKALQFMIRSYKNLVPPNCIESYIDIIEKGISLNNALIKEAYFRIGINYP